MNNNLYSFKASMNMYDYMMELPFYESKHI